MLYTVKILLLAHVSGHGGTVVVIGSWKAGYSWLYYCLRVPGLFPDVGILSSILLSLCIPSAYRKRKIRGKYSRVRFNIRPPFHSPAHSTHPTPARRAGKCSLACIPSPPKCKWSLVNTELHLLQYILDVNLILHFLYSISLRNHRTITLK